MTQMSSMEPYEQDGTPGLCVLIPVIFTWCTAVVPE